MESFAALSDPRRRAIVELLRSGERPVGALVDALGIAQSGVSRHLRILRDAGFVTARKDGQRRLYSLRPEPFTELAGWLRQFRQLWDSQASIRQRAPVESGTSTRKASSAS